jgi:nucleotidyltransferase/DNA polymerase involved in DNA repair
MDLKERPRKILHVDMDAFFASVEQLDHPELSGKPVIVGADPKNGRGRGVVAAASYEARAFGVHSAQPISVAYRLCKKGIFIRPNHARYAEISDRLMTVFSEFTPLVEPASLDEAYLDLTGTERLHGGAEKAGRDIQLKIQSQERLSASIGIGPNKMIAKIASDWKKPHGFVSVPPEDVQSFLDPLPVRKLLGIGEKTEQALSRLGIRTVRQLREYPEPVLVSRFGSMGAMLAACAKGEDESPVICGQEAKSISNEMTFEMDVHDPVLVKAALLELSEHVGYRLRAHHANARTVELKIRFEDFTTCQRHRTVSQPVHLGESIYRIALTLLNFFASDSRRIRLIGVGVSGLSEASTGQMSLLEDPGIAKNHKIAEAVDKIKGKFGENAVTRAGTLQKSDG